MVYIFILILFNSCNSANNNSFLKKAIDKDAKICPLIHTDDSKYYNNNYQKTGPTTSETNTRVPDIGYKAKFVVGAEASFDLNKAWEALKTLIFE